MSDIYEQHRTTLGDYVKSLQQEQNQIGAIFLVGDDFAGVDLFAHSSIFSKIFPKLIHSYALDAMESRSEKDLIPSKEAALKLLSSVADSRMEVHDAVVGEGPGTYASRARTSSAPR